MQASFFHDPMFRTFAAARPIATVTQMVLRRMLDSHDVDRLFDEHAQEQYHRSLLFSSLAQLVSGVVLGKHVSVNAGYKKMQQQLGVSLTAVYEKLQRVELPIVQQLVRHAFQQTVEICREVGGVARHDVAGYSTRILDGNWLSASEHRLTETRTSTAAPLPGKSLVVYDPRYHAVCDYFALEDRWEAMATISTPDFAAEVRTILQGVDLSRYRKSVRGPKQPPPKRTNKRKSVHVSTQRILDQRRK